MFKEILSLFLFISLLSSCASPVHKHAHNADLNPVILIPGTTRTTLIDPKTGEVKWGKISNFVGFYRKDSLALPIENLNLGQNVSPLVPGTLMKEVPVIKPFLKIRFYTKFLKQMQKIGYRIGDINHPKPGDNFFIFTYDWRRSSEENAVLLGKKITALKETLQQPDLRFDIIAHSSAVYLARYYSLYGTKDILNDPVLPEPNFEGTKHLRRLILIGPAHRGTVTAFQVLHEGYRPSPLPFVRRFIPAEIFTQPAFYELLPPPEDNIFINKQGEEISLDLYDSQNWIRYGWSIFNKRELKQLEKMIRKRYARHWQIEYQNEIDRRKDYLEKVLTRAKKFHEAIDEKKFPLTDKLDITIFVSRWKPTLNKVIFAPNPGLKFKPPHNKSLQVMGDGINTIPSMIGNYPEPKPKLVYFTSEHRKIASNSEMLYKLAELLKS